MPGMLTKWKWSSVLMIISSIYEAEVEIEALQVKLVYYFVCCTFIKLVYEGINHH